MAGDHVVIHQHTFSARRAEFVYTLTPVGRVFLALLGFLPLLAPYELLLKPHWPAAFTPMLLVPLVISAAALGLAALLWIAALGGRSSRVVFDRPARVLTQHRRGALGPGRAVRLAFAAVRAIEVESRVWSEGPDSHCLRVVADGVAPLRFGHFRDAAEAERTAAQLRAWVGVRADYPAVARLPETHFPEEAR